jgi:triphosphoribosyl-dephospho-CoA synthase
MRRPGRIARSVEECRGLDLSDAQTPTGRSHARPGGLGSAPSEDVRGPAQVDLRAMTLAAYRDRIARQYRGGMWSVRSRSACQVQGFHIET